MKKLAVIVTTLFAVQALAFGQANDYRELVSQKYVDELENTKLVRLIHDDGTDETRYLMPQNPFAEIVRENYVEKENGKFPFICETLYLIDKADYTNDGDISKMDIQAVSEIIRTVSKMKGMVYYSTTRKKSMVLYKNAYTLAGPEDTAPIEDKNTGNADGLKNWMLFDDASFGKCRYELNYRQTEDAFYMSYQNVEPMKVAFIEPVDKGDLLVHAVFIDCGDKVLIYIISDVDAVKFPGMRKQMESSMVSRMDALSTWLGEQFLSR